MLQKPENRLTPGPIFPHLQIVNRLFDFGYEINDDLSRHFDKLQEKLVLRQS
jgi:hypothetical protein